MWLAGCGGAQRALAVCALCLLLPAHVPGGVQLLLCWAWQQQCGSSSACLCVCPTQLCGWLRAAQRSVRSACAVRIVPAVCPSCCCVTSAAAVPPWVQGWVRVCPKFARHIFITDRMSRGGAGPDHEPAAWSMGNSMYQWLTTYFPTFKLEQTKQSQLHMEHYRHQALEQLGQAAADPLTLLAGAAPAALPALPAQQPQPAELGQQLEQMQQQQQEFQAAVLQQLEQLRAAAPAVQPAAQPAAQLAAVKQEPVWPADTEWDDFTIDLTYSSSLDYGSASESMHTSPTL